MIRGTMAESVRISERETIAAPPVGTPPDAAAPAAEPFPARLGRYRLLGRLGAGGFGTVYKAYDEELRRDVAIKVPHRYRVASPEQIELYLTEARILASLDHPGIVPAYDIGRTDDGLCYVVSKFVEGSDLRARLRQGPVPMATAVEISARLAEALQHAHQRGLVHRDVKPGNILLDQAGRPYITDFGLALREEDFGKGPICAGTPGYMSPEQARGEGHLVDARSDIYSLGVVLYEMLVGHVPFAAKRASDVVEQTRTHEPRPPRQLNAQVPRALDRIVLKALAARAADRYSTAADLAEDLLHWQGEHSQSYAGSMAALAPLPAPAAEMPAFPSRSEDRPLRVVPRGLRSFDAVDADFFLELLPGPRDRNGLPESLRFWKSRVEHTDPDQTFRVGLVYGPSGCGKSSFVKAGLLPRLAEHVLPCYVEATPADTEAQLVRTLRKRCPELSPALSLVEAIAHLRRAKSGSPGKKVLIVLDQFEQWLHDWPTDELTELVQALRQCDGQHVQAIIMVRDDFWMAATRFMRALEIRLVEGQNSAAVDLFDLRHARKVLAAFGRAFGALPDGPLLPEQERFVERSVAGLAQDGKVISVRLSLFAEMVKGKPWTPATLSAVGGAEGIGVAFLEEAFSAGTAPPQHRLHQQAARAVLQALLPEPGAAIKGHRRSRAELLEASGYAGRPQDFEELLSVLDTDLRLVTPAETDSPVSTEATPAPGARYYQLTHDYLVQPIRDWLTRKQRETWRGRAALRLAERTALWAPTRQSRFLPTLPEYLSFAVGVPNRERTPEAQSLMRAARQRHTLIGGSVILVLLLAGISIQQYLAAKRHDNDAYRTDTLVDRVLNAAPADVQPAIRELLSYKLLALPRLREKFADSATESTQKLHAAFALAALGEVEEEFLIERIPTALPREAENLIAALASAEESARTQLWERVQTEKGEKPRARYASTLLHLGDPGGAELLLALAPDPKYRTAFIHEFEHWHGELGALVSILQRTVNPAFQSGMSAALGLLDPTSLGEKERNSLEAVLASWYRLAPDGGTHSAAGWALRQWKAELPPLPFPDDRPADRDWFVNSQGMTMLRVPAGSFTMGDAELFDAKPRHVEIKQSFFVSDKEVPVDAFQRFIDDSGMTLPPATRAWTRIGKGNLDDTDPAGMILWHEALLFCNWLSLKEGRRPCYGRKAPLDPSKDVPYEGWNCDDTANGYRLPWAYEWEYACRAGATTAYFFGDDPALLPRYAVFIVNSNGRPGKGGSKLPNAWGLHDTYGNMIEWCWDKGLPTDDSSRAYRGTSFMEANPRSLRSGYKSGWAPANVRSATIGFRVVCSP